MIRLHNLALLEDEVPVINLKEEPVKYKIHQCKEDDEVVIIGETANQDPVIEDEVPNNKKAVYFEKHLKKSQQ